MNPAKPRIAVLSRNFVATGGGAERYAVALVEQLAAQYEIHVFAQTVDHAWPGVHYHRVSRPLRRPRWLNQLWFATATWWATRRGFAAVHSHENTWHGQVQTVHVLPVKHTLFQGRSGGQLALRWLKVLSSPRLLTYLALEHWRYAPQAGRQVVATSDSLRAIMARTYPACDKFLSVITPGIHLPPALTADEQAQQQTQARTQLGLPVTGTCLLFVANDYAKKGLATVLEALAQLPPSVVLAVVGNPDHIAAFSPQLQRLQLQQRVFFLGALKEVGPAYRAADALLHPSLEDTFAMVVLEAMAYSLPVLVSGPAYCGIAGLLQHGVNALVLDDPRDAAALAQQVQRCLARAYVRQSLGQAARAFAARYRWEDKAGQLADYYKLLAHL